MPRIGELDNSELGRIIARVRQNIHLPSPLPFYVTLGAVVGSHTDSAQPTWLMHVGPPGCGKSLMLSLMTKIPALDGNELGNPTGVAAFLTARKSKEKKRPGGHQPPPSPYALPSATQSTHATATGGLLNKIGSHGIITAKDFTTIIGKMNETRAEIICALREIYDGAWSRPVGGEGGESLYWEGKAGFIGCVTNAIDRHHAVISELGDRWVYWRWPASTSASRLMCMMAMSNSYGFATPIAEDVRDYLHGLGLAPNMSLDPTLTEHDLDRIYEMTLFLSRCRISIWRDPFKRDDYNMPQTEFESRSCVAFRNIYAGMVWAGVSHSDCWKVLYRLMMDSMPAVRGRIIKLLLTLPESQCYTSNLARLIPCGIPTATYALDDLRIADVVGEGAKAVSAGGMKYWYLTESSLKVLQRVERFIKANEEEYEDIELD